MGASYLAQGFSNNWTSGEVSDRLDDRVGDVQVVAQSCRKAQNLIVTTLGPLKKRRGFWLLGPTADPTQFARHVPFRRSVNDALQLQFSNLSASNGQGQVRVLYANGAPVLNGTVQVTFTHPFTNAQLALMRWKQVADVIYFFLADGSMAPEALVRNSDVSWQWNVLTYPNGPWLTENIDQLSNITLSGFTQTADVNPTGYGAATIMQGPTVGTATASKAIFNAGMVGDIIRLRQSTGNPSMRSWFSGSYLPVGWFVTYAGNIYLCTATAGSAEQGSMSTPPVHISGSANDGCNTLEYLNDGAGQIQITAYISPTQVSCKVIQNTPVGNGQATYCWALPGYSNDNGWPRAWPASVEERLATGGAAVTLDVLDLTRISGFTPTTLDYHPGMGSGQVIGTDAIRRRSGDTGAEIYWFLQSSFLLCGTADGEHVISGGMFGDPITPSTVSVRQLSAFGSSPDVFPARVDTGIVFATRGGGNVRFLGLDQQQNKQERDLAFMARHLFQSAGLPPPAGTAVAARKPVRQFAWLPDPDYQLWSRFSDGSLACFTMHDEQKVFGWTRQYFSSGWIVEDLVSLPGPDTLETLWLIASRVDANGHTQRVAMMQSRLEEGMFMDAAQFYSGPGVAQIGGLSLQVGQSVRVLANGVQLTPDPVVDANGNITVPAGTTYAMVGEPMPIDFITGKLTTPFPPPGTDAQLREIPEVIIIALAAEYQVGMLNSTLPYEVVVNRLVGGPPASVKRIWRSGLSGGDDRDPRIQILENTAFDFELYVIKPAELAGEM